MGAPFGRQDAGLEDTWEVSMDFQAAAHRLVVKGPALLSVSICELGVLGPFPCRSFLGCATVCCPVLEQRTSVKSDEC